MKRRRNHNLAFIPTDELIEEIINRNTFLGMVIQAKKEQHPQIKPSVIIDKSEGEFSIFSRLLPKEMLKIIDKLNTTLEK